jgi:hypothetical protein
MTTATTTCEGTIGQEAGDFGLIPVGCRQVVGLVRWFDSQGTQHAACIWHARSLERRYPACDPPWPGDLPEHADDMTFAKWAADRDGVA